MPVLGSAPVARTAPKLPCTLSRDGDDQALLNQVAQLYHENLEDAPALAYLERRGILAAAETFKLGYANRTLGYRLPEKNRVAGAELRGRLQRLGIMRESGHEHLSGSLTVPILDAAGNVVQMYGRKVLDTLRQGTPKHLYLPGPWRGVWNEAALAGQEEVILCEALIDALTFWCAGFANVTASYGVNGFTDEHLAAFKRHGIRRVLIAYDRDEAGDRGAEALAERLMKEGFACFRVQFPHGMDANEYGCKVKPASQSLALVVRSAVWLGQGPSPAREVREPEPPAAVEDEAATAAKEEDTLAETVLPLAAVEPAAPVPASAPELRPLAAAPPAPRLAAPLPPASPEPRAVRQEVPAVVEGDEARIELGDRRYRVRGLAKSMSYESLRVNLQVAREDAFHVDTLDIYVARHRQVFLTQAAKELGLAEDILKADMRLLLGKLEDLQEEQIKRAKAPKEPVVVTLSEKERAEAMALLTDPRLLDRILEDFERCGVVGEEVNKLTGYVAATSRKEEEPLAVVVQSNTAAGKTRLMDAILVFMPDEDRMKYSAMTSQSLFYMGDKDLKHKILAIVEQEGASRASYPLKLLLSEGELTIASTGKDPQTGKFEVQEYHVKGPVMLFLTTTAIEIDEELLNRCLILTVDEDRQQTRAIHRLQRQQQTLEGLLTRRRREKIIKLHQNAQRLLRPLAVVNPYANDLTFLDTKTRTRRDHMKYLGLIRAVTLLRQYQKEVKVATDEDGKPVEYVETELEDLEVAGRLACEVLGRTLDELPPQARALLMRIDEMVSQACARQRIARQDYRFSRRDVREHTGFSQSQLKRHLARLEELEYLIPHRGSRGQSYVYELVYDGQGKDGKPFLIGLIDVATLRGEATTAEWDGGNGHLDPLASEKSGGGPPQVRAKFGGVRVEPIGLAPSNGAGLSGSNGEKPENALPGACDEPSSSYAQGRSRSDGPGEGGLEGA